MRGAQGRQSIPSTKPRIIPADAGSTEVDGACQVDSRDHPRGCGEHGKVSTQQFADAGSSPRMRGAPEGHHVLIRYQGIIPADAGSTPRHTKGHPMCRDHPRGCGEHPVYPPFQLHQSGSSPRMRGARVECKVPTPHHRIIPADAGSTLRVARATRCTKDHPRGCGEHGRIGCADVFRQGSSPRMRGARTTTDRMVKCGGIIPADAGSTTRSNKRTPISTDHPRGCGEHLSH